MKNKRGSIDTQALTNSSTLSRTMRWAIVFLWMTGIWYLSDQPDLRSGLAHDFLLRKVAHMVEFGVLTLLVAWARARGTLKVPLLWALTYAMIDEMHQSWVVNRTSTWRDVVIDSLGIGLAALVVWYYTRRHPTTKISP